MRAPAVSVVMPIHNAAAYLPQSVESILGQTFEDFELIALENGSSDGSTAILREYAKADPRVRLIEAPRRLGLVGSANSAAAEATAPLLARMDADDVSHRERLQREIEIMDAEPDVVLVGVLGDGIDSGGRCVRPQDRSVLFRHSAFPFAHGSSMFRRYAFEDAGGYRAETVPWEDVDLFLRLGDRGRIVIVPEALYSYRYHRSCSTLSYPFGDAARQTDLLRRSLAARRVGQDHNQVLGSRAEPPSPDTIAATLYSRGSLRLWAGQRPGVLEDLLRSGSFKLDRTWLKTLAWAAWGWASPATLRFVLRWLVRARDLAASVRLGDGAPREWRFR